MRPLAGTPRRQFLSTPQALLFVAVVVVVAAAVDEHY